VVCDKAARDLMHTFAVLFAVYVDDIDNFLCSSEQDCYVGDMYVGCIMYASDIIVLSALLNMLRSMIKICAENYFYSQIL